MRTPKQRATDMLVLAQKFLLEDNDADARHRVETELELVAAETGESIDVLRKRLLGPLSKLKRVSLRVST